MKKLLGILVLGFLLSGCFATTAKYEAAINSWIGSSEDELVESWGVPNGVYNKNDGGKVLSYVRSGSMHMPGNTTSNTSIDAWGYATTTTTTSAGTNIALRCKTSFVVSSTGRITSWSYEGNNCYSR